MTDRELMRRILTLAVPVVFQNMLSAAVSGADVMMLNCVGQSAISAVSLATQYTNILYKVYFGLSTGITMLCAQYWGRGDSRAVRIIEGISLRISLFVSVLMAAAAVFFPKIMMGVFTEDAELILLGTSYLRVMSGTYLCWGLIEVYLTVLRSTGNVRVPTLLNMAAFSLNVVLNAVFIFGVLGAPRLGVRGVAIATLISRAVELAGCLAVSYHNEAVKLKLSYMLLKSRVLLSDFVKKAGPALANDISWGVAFSMYSVILGRMSSDALAANSVVTVVRYSGVIFCGAVANGGSIALGNLLGAGRLEEGRRCAAVMMRLSAAAGILGGVIIFCVSPAVLRYADLSDTALLYLKYMLYINCFYVMGPAVNASLITGVFRAGGDSRFGMICDTVTMWCYAVPVTWAAAFVFRLPVMYVYVLMCTDEFIKWPAVFRKYFSLSWLKNITRDEYGPADVRG